MSKSTRSRNALFAYLFWISLALTILVYILRGIGVLNFIPGGIILIFIGLTIMTAILYGIDKTRRF